MVPVHIGGVYYPVRSETLQTAEEEGEKRYQRNRLFRSKYLPPTVQQHVRGYLGELVAFSFLSRAGFEPQPNFRFFALDNLPDISLPSARIEVKTQQTRNWLKYGRTIPVSQTIAPHWDCVVFVCLKETTVTTAALMGWATLQQVTASPVVNYGATDNYQLPIEQVQPVEDLLAFLRTREYDPSSDANT